MLDQSFASTVCLLVLRQNHLARFCIGIEISILDATASAINSWIEDRFTGIMMKPSPVKLSSPLGLVKGSTIQTVNAIRDIGSGLKTLIGSELKKYNEMMDNTRAIATDRMVAEADRMGADAIVGVRFSSASIMQSVTEIMVYGTAVKFQ